MPSERERKQLGYFRMFLSNTPRAFDLHTACYYISSLTSNYP